MALVLSEQFCTFWTRQIFAVIAGAGTDVIPWRCIPLGGNEGSFLPFAEPTDAASIFELQPVPTPSGFSPFGDKVAWQPLPRSALLLTPVAEAPISIGVVDAVVWQWVEFVAFPGFTFAILIRSQTNGGGTFIERWWVADLRELSLLEKNPAFG